MQFISSVAIVACGLLSSSLAIASNSAEMSRYQTSCLLEEEGISTIRSLGLAAETFVLGQEVYLDEACATAGYRFDYTGSYTRDPAAETVDWLLEKVAITPDNDMIAGAFNQNKLCGIDTWEASVGIDVTGLECQGNVLLDGPTYFYDRLRETDEGIVLGLPSEDADGSTPELRPVEFEDVLYAPVNEQPSVPAAE